MAVPSAPPAADVYTPGEIARAAGVPVAVVTRLIGTGGVTPFDGFVAHRDAVGLVERLAHHRTGPPPDRAPLTVLPAARQRRGWPLVCSGVLHATLFLLLIVAGSLGLLRANDTEQQVLHETPLRLVYLVDLGPGGGGGGGGLKAPAPPPPIKRKAPERRPRSRPAPPVVHRPPPPAPPVRTYERPVPPPVLQPVVHPPPAPVEPPRPTLTVQAPIASIAADVLDAPGVAVSGLARPPSPGPGAGGGTGSGRGTGTGAGSGSGLGDGSGGGTGGGPYRPGDGVEPPSLLRQVKPDYTDEARRRSIEGDVVLQIVVRRDGTVGSIQVQKSLGAGLDGKAVEAVRQWRFAPATRAGVPVDVLVEVSVAFSLR